VTLEQIRFHLAAVIVILTAHERIAASGLSRDEVARTLAYANLSPEAADMVLSAGISSGELALSGSDLRLGMTRPTAARTTVR
jgi:hypothetical protein